MKRTIIDPISKEAIVLVTEQIIKEKTYREVKMETLTAMEFAFAGLKSKELAAFELFGEIAEETDETDTQYDIEQLLSDEERARTYPCNENIKYRVSRLMIIIKDMYKELGSNCFSSIVAIINSEMIEHTKEKLGIAINIKCKCDDNGIPIVQNEQLVYTPKLIEEFFNDIENIYEDIKSTEIYASSIDKIKEKSHTQEDRALIAWILKQEEFFLVTAVMALEDKDGDYKRDKDNNFIFNNKIAKREFITLLGNDMIDFESNDGVFDFMNYLIPGAVGYYAEPITKETLYDVIWAKFPYILNQLEYEQEEFVFDDSAIYDEVLVAENMSEDIWVSSEINHKRLIRETTDRSYKWTFVTLNDMIDTFATLFASLLYKEDVDRSQDGKCSELTAEVINVLVENIVKRQDLWSTMKEYMSVERNYKFAQCFKAPLPRLDKKSKGIELWNEHLMPWALIETEDFVPIKHKYEYNIPRTSRFYYVNNLLNNQFNQVTDGLLDFLNLVYPATLPQTVEETKPSINLNEFPPINSRVAIPELGDGVVVEQDHVNRTFTIHHVDTHKEHKIKLDVFVQNTGWTMEKKMAAVQPVKPKT
ncbi:MAG: hypothetical protein WC364_15520, partial [Eubacteriales bacterium]